MSIITIPITITTQVCLRAGGWSISIITLESQYSPWNLSYPGCLVHITICISEMSITCYYAKITNLNTSDVVIAIS